MSINTPNSIDAVLAAFDEYQRRTRGTCPEVRRNYARFARMFLASVFGEGPLDLAHICAAWKSTPRDRWIGWSDAERQRNLNFMTNNTRFLILPWVCVPHLASHILGRILRRLQGDWAHRYGHRVYLVETFVEKDRFNATCYKAANWSFLGRTQGRGRQDRHNTYCVPVKDILAYPLCKNFRQALVVC